MHAPQNTMPNAHADTWYVQVNGQTYGPYSGATMQGFVAEGRINAQSIISQTNGEGYANAAQFQSFMAWSAQHPVPAQQSHMQTVQTEKSQNAQVLRPISATGGGVLARQMQPTGYAPQAVAPNPAPTPQFQPSPQPQAKANTVFIVMAEIRSVNGMQFLQALQSQGQAQRIGDSVWLLRCGISVEQLRNILSQTLTRDDRLFLLDSFANKTAWFNIGSDMDKRVRELWDIES